MIYDTIYDIVQPNLFHNLKFYIASTDLHYVGQIYPKVLPLEIPGTIF